MKRFKFLFVFFIFILISCSAKSVNKLKFPFEEGTIEIDYDNDIVLKKLIVDDNKVYDNYNDLSKAIDMNLFNSISDSKNKYYYKLNDTLTNDFIKDPITFLRSAIQIAPMAHNFLYSYDDSKINENIIGIDCHYTSDYASNSYYKDNVRKIVNYEFYQNSLNNDDYKILF